MAEPSPAFQFYPKDFLTDGKQAAMSAEEVGIYIRLLCVNWVEGTLPGDLERLARIGGVSLKRMQLAWVALQGCFKPDPNNPAYGIVQPRIEKERAKQAAFRVKQTENGRRGGRPAKQKPDETQALTQTEPDVEPKKSSSSSSSVKEKEKSVSVPSNLSCTDPVIGKRAGTLIEFYADLYPTLRNGTPYRRQDVIDFPTVYSLCATWPDERLRLMAEIFLRTDHKFAAAGRRSIRQFAALAEWCDNRLREHGR